VIEQFDPDEVVMLNREADGALAGTTPMDTHNVKPKIYRNERRQFAEAILGKAVIVVEGGTETSLLSAASAVLEASRPETYTHLDFAGVSVFEADGDGNVPMYGPVFRALGKVPFGLIDKQAKPFTEDARQKLASYEQYWESPEKGSRRYSPGRCQQPFCADSSTMHPLDRTTRHSRRRTRPTSLTTRSPRSHSRR
jgi:putative ATP-dependent endonuclease of OLD family